MSDTIKSVYWVPGMPHLLRPELNENYKSLALAMDQIAKKIEEDGIERIFYYSTSWLSVLGQSLQAKPKLEGLHVDENWHDLCDLPFSFKVDDNFAKKAAAALEQDGYQTKLINYEGFPVDTGTIVADKLINTKGLPTGMLSCCVYSDFKETKELGRIIAKTLNEGQQKTAVVCVSGLSGNYFTTEIDLREDQFRSKSDDEWNRRFTGFLANGNYDAAEALVPEYAKATKADMGLKALAFARGIASEFEAGKKATVLGYGPIYGTGALVAQLY